MSSPDVGRYDRPKGQGRSEEEWHELGRNAIVALLEREHAVTISEMEARISDRVFDPTICPDSIDPHILTTARNELLYDGTIVSTVTPGKGLVGLVKTWSFPIRYPLISKIEDAAQRKRLLTSRHNGWSERGGRSRGLIGQAGEDALAAALRSDRTQLSQATGSTKEVLGVDVAHIGEIDNSAHYIDFTDPSKPAVITVIFEVKNTRAWHYADDYSVQWFLHKVATIQAHRPTNLILPVFVCRRRQITLWNQGLREGFLPAQVNKQLVVPDAKLTQEHFDEVRVGLGYEDMALYSRPTNYHLGLVDQAMTNRARSLAELWAQNHPKYLRRPAKPSPVDR